MPWLRAEELASCWHGSICGFLAKTLQDQTRNKNNVYWWRNGPHRQLYRCPPTTWNYRSGLQIVPRGWASPPTSSVDLWLGQFDWHTGRKHDAEVLGLNAFKTLFVIFSVELQGIVKDLLQLFFMWHCVTVSGISLSSSPQASHMICIFFFKRLMPSLWDLTIVLPNILVNAITLMLFLILRLAFQMFWL